MKNQILPTFWVQQRVVYQARCWLKINNPDYYGEIEIDDSRLAELSEDNIPEELMHIVKHSDDGGLVD